MKILSSEQIREADQHTIKQEPISSVDLMERAARGCVGWIADKLFLPAQGAETVFVIFCGLGNNGGDGLAMARLLVEKNYKVEVYIIRHSEKTSEDFRIKEERLLKLKIPVHNITSAEQLAPVSRLSSPVFIDALFGSGLSGAVTGLAADAIKAINQSGETVISIDIPSGLSCDTVSLSSSIVKATHTLTFELPKLSFLFPENAEYVGDWHIIPIGLDSRFIATCETKNFFITKTLASKLIKFRKKFSHKGTYGHALLIAGAYGKIGAGVLASRACLKAGVGLLTTHVPQCGNLVLQTAVPEAMLDTDEGEKFFSSVKDIAPYNAVAIGPGIEKAEETQRGLKRLIQDSSVPLIMDADAINILAENKTWLDFVPKHSIYTPHMKEFERLIGKTTDSFERMRKQLAFAEKYGVYIVLKGAHTAIACPDGECYFNSTGNPGMATGGTGDVLTGIILSLMAQGYRSKEVCILGVFLHGLAGDIAADKFSEQGMTAGDVIDNIAEAYKDLINVSLTQV